MRQKRRDIFEEIKKKNKTTDTLTTHQFAILSGVTPTTVIKWIKDGKIEAKKTIGGHRRIPVSEFERLYPNKDIPVENTPIEPVSTCNEVLCNTKTIKQTNNTQSSFLTKSDKTKQPPIKKTVSKPSSKNKTKKK